MNTFEYENIITGVESNVITEAIEVAAGQDLVKGQVFTLNSVGQAIQMTTENEVTDIYGIMAETVSTGPEKTKNSTCYTRGQFNTAKIILPTSTWASEHKATLQGMGIFLKNI